MKVFKWIIVSTLCLGLCACGKDLPMNRQEETIVTESTVSGMMGGMQVINPLKEVTLDEMVAETGISFCAPEGAKEVRYFVLSYDDCVMAQMKFLWNDAPAYLRAQATSAVEAEDISGLHYQWTTTSETQVGYCAATTYLKDGVGYTAWLDTAPGIVYNLCMTEGADADTLSELANAVFVPVQGDADGEALE